MGWQPADSINAEMLPGGMAWAFDVKELVGLLARPPQRSRPAGQRANGADRTVEPIPPKEN